MPAMRDEALRKAIDAVGSTAKLAAALGLSSQAISQWEEVPAHRVLAVERATGGKITRHELRPDLYPDDDRPVLPQILRFSSADP